MSNEQLALYQIKQAQRLLLDIKSVKEALGECNNPVPISIKHFLLVTVLSIIIFSLFETEITANVGMSMIAALIYLGYRSKKMTEKKLKDNKNQIIELNRKKKELYHSLNKLNIGTDYLNSNTLDKFEYYLRNNLAETIKECAKEYVRECEREEQLAELRKISAKQEEFIDEHLKR